MNHPTPNIFPKRAPALCKYLRGWHFLAAILLFLGCARPAPPRWESTAHKLQIIDIAIRKYYTTYDKVPTGNTAEIISILSGVPDGHEQNPDGMVFIESKYLESDGQIYDWWGSLIEIEKGSLWNHFYIWSRGPNEIPDSKTGDDIVWEMQINGPSKFTNRGR